MPGSRRTTVVVSVLIAVLAGCGEGDDDQHPPALRAGEGGGGPGSPEFGDHVARVPGRSATDVAATSILAAYPPGDGAAPRGWLAFPAGDWHAAANAAQFAAEPVDAGLLPIERDYLPPAASDLVARIDPAGFPHGDGVETVLLGTAGDDVVAGLEEAKLKVTRVAGISPAQVAGELVAYRGGWARAYSDTVIAVSAADRDFALPAMSWSAYSGDTVVFVGPDGVPADSRALLAQREELRLRKPTIYLVGPRDVLPDTVAGELAEFGAVRRIAAASPVEASIELARYRDEETAFGWGLDRGPASLLFANLSEPGDAVAALNLSAAGPQAPLILLDDARRLPRDLVEYLGELRNRAGNQGFVAGDRQSVSSGVLAELDRLLAPGEPAEPGDRRRAQNG